MDHGNTADVVPGYSKLEENVNPRAAHLGDNDQLSTKPSVFQHNRILCQESLDNVQTEITKKPRKANDRVMYSQSDNSMQLVKLIADHIDIELDDIIDDVSSQYLDEPKNTLYTTYIAVSTEQADNIKQVTREQSESDLMD